MCSARGVRVTSVSRTGSIKVGALVLSASLVLGGGDALAKKKKGKAKKPGPIVTRSASAGASGNGSVVTATATCPGKTKAISGGFSQTPVGPGTSYAGLVYESQKVGQKSWRVSSQVVDSGPPDSISLTTFVYCRKNVKGTSAASASVPKPAVLADGPSVAASCAGKKKAMGGGSFTSPPVTGPSSADSILTGSLPAGPLSWQSQVLSGAAGANTLTSVAYCAKGKAPTTVSTTGSVPPPNVAVTTTVSCSGKKRMIAGGFSQTPQGAPPTGYFLVHESVRNGDKTWSVSGVKVGPPAIAPIAAGYCAA